MTASRSRIARTILYYASFIALGLSAASTGPTLPGLAEQTSTRLGEISFLFTARSIGYLVGSILGGRLYDRQPGHRVQSLSLLAMAVLLALVPLQPLLLALALVLALLGFAEGTLDVGGNTLLVWVHRQQVGPYMSGLHFFFGVGALLSPLIVARTVATSGGIAWAYWSLALLLLPAAAGLWFLPSPKIQAGAQDNRHGPVNAWVVAAFMLFFFLNVGAEGSVGGWLFTYTRRMELANEANAAYLTSAFWGALTLGRLLSVPLSARFHPRWILLADLLVCMVGVGVILFWSGSLTALWIGAMSAGLGMASVFPATMTLAEQRLPINGKITGLFFVGASSGSMLFPWLIGQLFEPYGPSSAMWVILIGLLAALASFLPLWRGGLRADRL